MSTDIATALDHILGDPNTENKFQALKQLHAKKIKSLMTSIDAQQKEIGKLKTLNKDNHRTQIIQNLKKKLKEQELVVDVLKEELARKAEMEHGEVNELIIRKTISGPKRFRPLTREELENQIAELEKKTKVRNSSAVPVSSNGDASVAESKAGRSRPVTPANGAKRPMSRSSNMQSDSKLNDDSDPNYLLKISELQNKMSDIQRRLDTKDGLINELKDEVSRLRATNASLVALEEEHDIMQRQHNDLALKLERMEEDLTDTTEKLSTAEVQMFQERAAAESELEQKNLELETLREQCTQGLKQNTQLLRRMAEIENQLDKALRSTGGGRSSTVNSPGDRPQTPSRSLSPSKANTALQEKLRQANAKISTLEAALKGDERSSTADSLREALRDKNETIRDLKRTIAEMSRLNKARVAHADGSHVAESKHGDDMDRKSSSKGLSNGSKSTSNSGNRSVPTAIVKLTELLLQFEIQTLESTDGTGPSPMLLNSLLGALQRVLLAQQRAQVSPLDTNKEWVVDAKKITTLEHLLNMKYAAFINDDDDDELIGASIPVE
mmetsp:Transcript_9625/g.14487  ORF Transcript_9625/g.14487 Transcript_9625/m.14487 type:complete len:555 (+) Transcript_9625:205-1869(+)|eukprot:CAMPEP_0185040630 /NCGR_PEP_ID=MMETSP1103-20130426/38897_1 /TAXON_ID=36769 /ORGANISM="Paraphysomonas bandaiensis, Strain Caron Lab Isolate" /LENGTH=554 /DNA_ID=CAMNT_0027580009 /DNA_START=86 /DNA_END=1750 /DNA_ORIENTATION=-